MKKQPNEFLISQIMTDYGMVYVSEKTYKVYEERYIPKKTMKTAGTQKKYQSQMEASLLNVANVLSRHKWLLGDYKKLVI